MREQGSRTQISKNTSESDTSPVRYCESLELAIVTERKTGYVTPSLRFIFPPIPKWAFLFSPPASHYGQRMRNFQNTSSANSRWIRVACPIALFRLSSPLNRRNAHPSACKRYDNVHTLCNSRVPRQTCLSVLSELFTSFYSLDDRLENERIPRAARCLEKEIERAREREGERNR